MDSIEPPVLLYCPEIVIDEDDTILFVYFHFDQGSNISNAQNPRKKKKNRRKMTKGT